MTIALLTNCLLLSPPFGFKKAFHSQDRIHTSRPFCRKMGLQDRVLPFSLVLFLTSSMTHADAAKVQVGFGRVNYIWPAFAGDTFTKSFTLESIRNTSDGNHSVGFLAESMFYSTDYNALAFTRSQNQCVLTFVACSLFILLVT